MLRADVPTLEDEQFALTLAEVARSSTTVSVRRRVPLGVKVGAIAASVAVTMFGVAYASDFLAPTPPTNSDPSSPGTDEPPDREREIRGPDKSDEPVDADSPSVTKSSHPDDSPTETDSESTPDDAVVENTTPTDTEDAHQTEGPGTEQPPAPGEPDSGDDESEGDPDSGDDSDSGSGSGDETEPDDDSGPGDETDPDDDSGPGDETEPDDDSGPEPEDESTDDSSDDD